jgi:hypothetical protein
MKTLSQPLQNFTLHPLIHTFPTKSSAPDVEKKKAEPKTPQCSLKNE